MPLSNHNESLAPTQIDPDDPRFLTYGGRTMLRVRGGDGTEEAGADTEDQPVDSTAAETEQQADEPEPEYFSDTFDPATLSDELRPAYQQMRADYTRKTQSLAEERRENETAKALYSALTSDDPDIRAQALALVQGIDPDEFDEDVDDEDGEDAPLTRAEFERWKAEQEATQAKAQQAAAEEDALIEDFVALEQAVGREFNAKQGKALLALAEVTPDENGRPSLKNAYELLFTDLLAEEKARYAESKKAPSVPRGGSAATQVPDLDDPEVRHAHMAERAAQMLAAEAG